MDSNLKENRYKFPKAAIIIIIYLSCLRVVYNCIKSVLALYLVDVLQFKEENSVTLVHSFIICSVTFSMLGGILCDSWLGRFKSIVCFSTVLIFALFLLVVSSVTVLHLPIRELTLVTLILVALGYGSARPCGVAFGGDQFILPQQSRQLSFLFLLYCTGNNIGSLSTYFIVPVLRKDVTCFGKTTCYPLVFLLPTILITFMTVMLLLTKRLYVIKKSEGTVALDVVKCTSHAIYRKIKSSDKHLHWLDYACDKYDRKLIEDIKSVSHVLKLFLPMPMFWALFSMQNSLWTFQASRMNGEFIGYLIKPDQILAINPLFVIIFVPIFHSYAYPVLEKYLFLRTPLRKITTGCIVLALSCVCSGVLELNLEPTYAVTPTAGTAQLRIFNTLYCNASIIIDERKFTLEKLSMWENISIPTSGKKFLKYKADFHDCEMLGNNPKLTEGELEVKENQATSWVLTNEGMNYNFIDTVEKSATGNPLVRALIYIDKDFAKDEASLKLVYNDRVLKEITVSKNFRESELVDVIHKKYDLYLNGQLVESNCSISVGGVYTIVGHVYKSAVVARTVTVTQPNSVHIFWMLPQEILLSVSEIMIEVLMMEFAFSQAPPSMKTLLQSSWLFTGVFGNIIVIAITEFKPIKRRAYEFFLYAILMILCAITFGTIAFFYKYKEYSSSEEVKEDESNALQDEAGGDNRTI